MDNRKNERTETTHEVILRMSDAVEDAPYALESAKVVDAKPASSCTGVRLAASCREDDPNLPGVRRAVSCVGIKLAASCMTDAGGLPRAEPASKNQK